MKREADEKMQEADMPLTAVQAGQQVRVRLVDAGNSLKARLSAMGLTQGMTAEVLSSNGGPIILSVMGSRLVLGRGMAAHILVKPLPVKLV